MVKGNKKRWINSAAFVLGVAILVGLVVNLGWDETMGHLRAVGWGFGYLVCIVLTSILLEVWAWRIAIGGKVGVPTLLGIALAGTAVNSLTPLGEGGELIKVNLLSAHVPMQKSISSVLVWNICFRLTKHLVIFVGILVMPLLAPEVLGGTELWAFLLAAVISFVPTAVFFLALMKGSANLVVSFLQKVPIFRRRSPEKLQEAATAIDEEVKAFAQTKRSEALFMCLLLTLARFLAALEIVVVMGLLGSEVGLVHGLFLYCATMILRNFLSISPVQIGVAEGGESFLFKLLGFPMSVGFAQAFVRVLRLMLFNVVGLLYLGAKSFAGANPADTTESSEAQAPSSMPDETNGTP